MQYRKYHSPQFTSSKPVFIVPSKLSLKIISRPILIT